MPKSVSTPSNYLHIALPPDAGYADLTTCCITLQISQPFPSSALTHLMLAGEDPDKLPIHTGVTWSGTTVNSFDWF